MSTPHRSAALPPLDPERLMAETGWMRRLALRLVGDAQRADDLTQDTWVRALESPPRQGLPLRAWLTTVMHNLWRRERRGHLRRGDREWRAAQDREQGAPEQQGAPELLARANAQGEILQAVVELAEPYRSTLLLRYFEELPPQRIAQRQGLSVSTVKTRLARGLDLLRRRLDAKHGSDGFAWLSALAPLVRPPAGALTPALPLAALPPLSLGALVVNAKLVPLLVVAAALGAGYYFMEAPTAPAEGRSPAPGELRAAAGEPTPDPAGEPDSVDTEALPRGEDRRAVQVPAADTPPVVPSTTETGRLIQGRVVDPQGTPVPGLGVVTLTSREPADGSGSAPLARSDADGNFEFVRDDPADPRSIGVRDPGFVTVMSARPSRGQASRPMVVVVAPRLSLSGRVVDELGLAVPDARVKLAPAETLRADIGVVMDASTELGFETTSAADGSFVLERAPRLPGGTLSARRSGYAPALEAAPLTDHQELVLVLGQPTVERATLSGVVVDPQGFPVAGALVALGVDTQPSASDGSFTFDLADPESFNIRMASFVELDTGRLTALHPGHLPATLASIGEDERGRPLWPEPVVLRLGAEPLSLTGRVVDEQGRPQAGLQVWIEDPTFFGGLAGEERGSFPRMTHVETQLAGLDPGWPFVETDARGGFQLDGLLDRAYTLEVMDPVTLLRRRESVRAGRRVELVFTRGEVFERLEGRVVDGRGEPVAGASVGTHCDAFRTRIDGQVVGTRHARGSQVVTDARGGFVFESVPKDLVYLRIDHPETIPLEWGRREQELRSLVGERSTELEVQVMRRCHFQVELRSADAADAIEMHDAEGRPLTISEFEGNGRRDGPRAALTGGRTNLLAVGDAATTLVLFSGGQEVRRVAVTLTPGDRPTLRP